MTPYRSLSSYTVLRTLQASSDLRNPTRYTISHRVFSPSSLRMWCEHIEGLHGYVNPASGILRQPLMLMIAHRGPDKKKVTFSQPLSLLSPISQ